MPLRKNPERSRGCWRCVVAAWLGLLVRCDWRLRWAIGGCCCCGSLAFGVFVSGLAMRLRLRAVAIGDALVVLAVGCWLCCWLWRSRLHLALCGTGEADWRLATCVWRLRLADWLDL